MSVYRTLDVTPIAAGEAVRTPNRMILRLRGDNRLLQAHQKLLCLCQRHPQVCDVAKVPAPAKFHHVKTCAFRWIVNTESGGS